TMCRIRIRIHAGTVAVELVLRARQHTFSVDACVLFLAGIAAGAAVRGIGLGIHAGPFAFDRSLGAGARSLLANAAFLARVSAAAAVRRVRRRIHAGPRAFRKPRRAAAQALPVDADALATGIAAAAAVVAVGFRIHALPIAFQRAGSAIRRGLRVLTTRRGQPDDHRKNKDRTTDPTHSDLPAFIPAPRAAPTGSAAAARRYHLASRAVRVNTRSRYVSESAYVLQSVNRHQVGGHGLVGHAAGDHHRVALSRPALSHE